MVLPPNDMLRLELAYRLGIFTHLIDDDSCRAKSFHILNEAVYFAAPYFSEEEDSLPAVVYHRMKKLVERWGRRQDQLATLPATVGALNDLPNFHVSST